MLEILLGLLTKTLNLSEDEIKSLILKEDSEDELKEDVVQILLAKDADRISQIKSKHTDESQNQYKRGIRETAEKFENDIKRIFGIESDLQGEELLAEVKSKLPEGSGEGDELTDDKVKAHPLYIALQNEKKKEIDQIKADHQIELETAKGEYDTTLLHNRVVETGVSKIKSKNPILPEDATKAQARLSVVGQKLNEYSWKADGDTLIPVDEKGHQLVDGHNNPITFDDIVENIGSTYFDFEEGDGGAGGSGSGGGNGTGNGNGFGKNQFSRVKVPQTPEELQAAMQSAKTSEERAAISEAYTKAQSEK